MNCERESDETTLKLIMIRVDVPYGSKVRSCQNASSVNERTEHEKGIWIWGGVQCEGYGPRCGEKRKKLGGVVNVVPPIYRKRSRVRKSRQGTGALYPLRLALRPG